MQIHSLLSGNAGISPRSVKSSSGFAAELDQQVAKSRQNKTAEKTSPYRYEFDRIKEVGLLQYVNEVREEKLREQILAMMGLTEEALKLMSPEERMDVEKRIAEEIQKRQEAESALVQEEKKLSPLHDYFREKSVLPKKRPGNDMSIHHEIS